MFRFLTPIVKLTSRAYKCAFIGYAINNIASRFYDRNAKVIIELIFIDIYEKKYPCKLNKSGGTNGKKNKFSF